MKNKIGFKKWLTSIFVGSNIKTKWSLFVGLIWILVLFPYTIKLGDVLVVQLQLEPKPMYGSTMLGVSLYKNIINFSSFNFDGAGPVKLNNFIKEGFHKLLFRPFEFISPVSAFAEEISNPGGEKSNQCTSNKSDEDLIHIMISFTAGFCLMCIAIRIIFMFIP